MGEMVGQGKRLAPGTALPQTHGSRKSIAVEERHGWECVVPFLGHLGNAVLGLCGE